MTKPPTRGSLLRKIERLEKQIQLLESMRSIDAQSWRDMARRCTEAEVRVRWALSILQTGELPEGADGALIPLRFGDCWMPIIELDTGRVRDWPEGTTADIHYKVCDAGEYELLDGKRVVAERSGYVPDLLGVSEPAYGDYIIMKIGADGLIEGWEPPQIDPDGWSWALQS